MSSIVKMLLSSIVIVMFAMAGCGEPPPKTDNNPTPGANPALSGDKKAAKPGTEEPAKPGTEEPAKPGTEEPAKPGTEDPAKPGTEDPAKPGTEDPAKPGTEDPAKPGTEEPAKPGTEEPAKPGTEDPAKADGDDKGAESTDELARRIGPVGFEILPQFGKVKKGEPGTLNVLVKLRGDDVEVQQRAPLDIAIIIDKSGSMRGDKVHQVKKAARDLVSKLNRLDRVTLVTYASDVSVEETRVPMDKPGREKVIDRINRISAGGSTALGPALFNALDILEKAEREDTDIAHVLLLSDGLANVGESRPEVLGARTGQAFAKGVSVSSLGVGLDYAEDLMTRLADQGGGRYHFIKDAQQIAGVLNDELSGLSTTVARGIVLTFEPAKGVTMDKVFGYPTWEEDDETRIKIGTLYGKQDREILMRLKLDEPVGDNISLGTFFLKFRDVTQGGEKLRDEFTIAVGVTEEAEDIKKSERQEVTIRLAEVESASAMEKAARAVERGDYHAARTIINSNVGVLKQQAATTGSARLRNQLKDMEASVDDVDKAEGSAEERKIFIKSKKASSYKTQK